MKCPRVCCVRVRACVCACVCVCECVCSASWQTANRDVWGVKGTRCFRYQLIFSSSTDLVLPSSCTLLHCWATYTSSSYCPLSSIISIQPPSHSFVICVHESVCAWTSCLSSSVGGHTHMERKYVACHWSHCTVCLGRLASWPAEMLAYMYI